MIRNLIVGLKAQPTKKFVILNLFQNLLKKQILNHLTAAPTDTSSQGSLRIACSFCKVQDDMQGRASVGSSIYPRVQDDMHKKQGLVTDIYPLPNKIAKAAFTLAEVLITLGIIGVVAAITIPGLLQRYQEKLIVNNFKQTYSILNNAVRMMMEEENCLGSSCYSIVQPPDIETIASQIDKHFKYADKKCFARGKGQNVSWLPSKVYALDGTAASYSTYAVGWVYGADNSNTCFYKMYNGATVSMVRMNAFGSSGILNISIDANGKAGPNRVGKDTFPVTSSDDDFGIKPYYVVHTWSSPKFWSGLCWSYTNRVKTTCPASAASPAAYVMQYGKLPDLTVAGFPAKP